MTTAPIAAPPFRKRSTASPSPKSPSSANLVVPGRIAEQPERPSELLREEGRDDVVARVGVAGEDAPERGAVVRGVRPVLDATMPAEHRVVELGDVADRVDAGPAGGEALVDDDPAAHLEARVTADLHVRLDADAGDDEARRPGSPTLRAAGRRRAHGRSRGATRRAAAPRASRRPSARGRSG